MPLAARALRYLPLALLVTTWVSMGELLQGLQVGWARPWTLTFAIHSGYALALVPYFFLRRARLARGARGAAAAPRAASAARVALGTLFLSALSSTVAATWYASLAGTSVAGNSAVYQASSAFALLFSALFLRERVTAVKTGAVALALAGVALVAAGAPAGGRDTPAGYAWVTASTALYAAYEVAFARIFGAGGAEGAAGGAAAGAAEGAATEGAAEAAPLVATAEAEGGGGEDAGGAAAAAAAAAADAGLAAAETSARTLGLMGVWTMATQWPVFFLAAALRLEPLDLAPPGKAPLIATAVALDSLFAGALLWGVATTSPFEMNLASTLVVPATIAADAALHGTLPSPASAAGTVLVLAAVAVLQAPPGAAAAARAAAARACARA